MTVNYELIDKINKKRAELKQVFHRVIEYIEDYDSPSINDRHWFDLNDVIRTDGSILFKPDVSSSHCRICIGGGTYIICASRLEDKSWYYSLFIDRPFIVDKYDEVIQQYNKLKDTVDDMIRYMG